MQVTLTTTGAKVFRTAGFLAAVTFKAGDAYGYAPVANCTDLRGKVTVEGVISEYKNLGNDTFLYRLKGDTFGVTFGEVGVYDKSGVLLALAVWEQSATVKGSFALDFYVTATDVWVATDNKRIPVVPTVNSLPSPTSADANFYMVRGAGLLEPFLAYTDGGGQWSFSGYEAVRADAIDSVPNANAVRLKGTETLATPAFSGELILQVQAGETRTVRAIAVEGSGKILVTLDTPLNDNAIVGRSVVFLRTRPSLGNIDIPKTYELPTASARTLGGVKVGRNLIVEDGVLHAVPKAQESLHVNNIIGAARVAITGSYNDLIDKPSIPKLYKLQAATPNTLGGVTVGDGLDIDANGKLSVIGMRVDASSVYTVQTFNHYEPNLFVSDKPVYVLTAMYPMYLSNRDIIVTLEEPFKADMQITLELDGIIVGIIEIKPGTKRGVVNLTGIGISIGQQLRFRVTKARDATQIGGWGAGFGMTIAIRSGQIK